MFERFAAEWLQAQVDGEPAGDVVEAAMAAIRRSGLLRECLSQILACVLGQQPTESDWGAWLEEAEQEAIRALALNPTRQGMCAAVIDVLRARGIGFDILGRWAFLN